MNKLTKSYRTAEIRKVNNGNFDFLPTIRIVGSMDGKTKCLSITEQEYEKICDILTDK